jgi:hypothetical protein
MVLGHGRDGCASPIFKLIAYKLSFIIMKQKYFEEKTTATLKIKQTSSNSSQPPDPYIYVGIEKNVEPFSKIN